MHNRTRGPFGVTAALLLVLAGSASAQTLPQEVQVGTREIKDFEFDTARNGVYCASCNGGAGNSRMAYIDTDHNLWVGGVNFSNGYFNPPDGEAVLSGILVEERAMMMDALATSGWTVLGEDEEGSWWSARIARR